MRPHPPTKSCRLFSSARAFSATSVSGASWSLSAVPAACMMSVPASGRTPGAGICCALDALHPAASLVIVAHARACACAATSAVLVSAEFPLPLAPLAVPAAG